MMFSFKNTYLSETNGLPLTRSRTGQITCRADQTTLM